MRKPEGVQNGIYYLFDCLNGTIGGELITADEVSARLYGDGRTLTENELKIIAANYEAELFKYEYRDGEEVERRQLTRLAEW